MGEGDFGMIREATLEDVPALVEMGRYFADRAQIKELGDIGFCEQSVGTMIETLIKGNDTVVFVDTLMRGCIGGGVYPFWMNTAHLASNGLFWWVTEEARASTVGRKLWTALEKWSKTKGCTLFQMTCLEGYEPNRIEEMYKRRGYVPLEHVFTKVL